MYRVIHKFKDLSDGKIYYVGDTYPGVGIEVADARIAELASEKNKLKAVLIEEVKEEKKKAVRKTTKKKEDK